MLNIEISLSNAGLRIRRLLVCQSIANFREDLLDAKLWQVAAELCTATSIPLDTTASLTNVFDDLEERGYLLTLQILDD
jgi:hypothetical protein